MSVHIVTTCSVIGIQTTIILNVTGVHECTYYYYTQYECKSIILNVTGTGVQTANILNVAGMSVQTITILSMSVETIFSMTQV